MKNEKTFIKKTINAIKNQKSLPNKVEIIIADGNSDDGTKDIIRELAKNDPEIIIINNPQEHVSYGFNLALSICRGKTIFRIDGHAEIPHNYLQNCLRLLNSEDADIVGGVIKTISSGSVGKAIAISQSTFFGVGGVKFRNTKYKQSSYVNTLAFGVHKREIFYEIGGYDEDMVCNQDDEFNFRAVKAGKKIWMDPSIKTKYYSRSNYRQLFKQYFNYGCYKVRGIQKRKSIFSIRHLIPSTFIILLMGTSILGYIVHLPWISFSVIFLYLIVNLISSTLVSKKVFQIPLIFLSFWILHFGYGLGFIWGLIRFSGVWRDNSLKDDHFNREEFIANSGVSI